jgi:hypothetical protein
VSATLGHVPDLRIAGLLVDRAAFMAIRTLPERGTGFVSACSHELILGSLAFLGLAKKIAPRDLKPRIEKFIADATIVLQDLRTDADDRTKHAVTSDYVNRLALFSNGLMLDRERRHGRDALLTGGRR